MTRQQQHLARAWLGAACAVALLGGACTGEVGVCTDERCPAPPGCENSQIVCDPEHVCFEEICEGKGWLCGTKGGGSYGWYEKSAPCDDNDPCTVDDICATDRKCVGTAMTCNTPPTAECADSTTLRYYDTFGKCQEGSCRYEARTVSCAKGCAGGKCVGEPCKGVTCDKPPGPCYSKPGTCDPSSGVCKYAPIAAGQACASTDACVLNATCDAAGKCTGTKLDCSRPNTTGAVCVSTAAGPVCQGYTCTSGYGNCNATDKNWADGCETQLNTTSNCGACGKTCGSVANTTSVGCNGTKCTLTCKSPYKDCDGKFDNGCEIPEGVGDRCHRGGLGTSSGGRTACGTPYCAGANPPKTDSTHENFGTWYCKFCSHCWKISGYYYWCLFSPTHESGGGKGLYSSTACTGSCSCGGSYLKQGC